jgi:hypothetical protein
LVQFALVPVQSDQPVELLHHYWHQERYWLVVVLPQPIEPARMLVQQQG